MPRCDDEPERTFPEALKILVLRWIRRHRGRIISVDHRRVDGLATSMPNDWSAGRKDYPEVTSDDLAAPDSRPSGNCRSHLDAANRTGVPFGSQVWPASARRTGSSDLKVPRRDASSTRSTSSGSSYDRSSIGDEADRALSQLRSMHGLAAHMRDSAIGIAELDESVAEIAGANPGRDTRKDYALLGRSHSQSERREGGACEPARARDTDRPHTCPSPPLRKGDGPRHSLERHRSLISRRQCRWTSTSSERSKTFTVPTLRGQRGGSRLTIVRRRQTPSRGRSARRGARPKVGSRHERTTADARGGRSRSRDLQGWSRPKPRMANPRRYAAQDQPGPWR